MNRRPVVNRPPVDLNADPATVPIWEALVDLSSDESQPEWTLIGGLMVMLHAAEHDVAPLRFSRDLDVVVNARLVGSGVGTMAANLEKAGFELAGASPDGIAHRYVRGIASIHLLS